jgi:large subunit ribosomal protein L17
MRHRVKNKRVGHNAPLSNSILRNLATSIILYEKVKTTKGRAVKVKSVLEKLITMAKNSTPYNAVRSLNAYLLDAKASDKMMADLLSRYKDRKSGFLRVTHLGHRAGDAAEMVQIELV